MSGQWEVVGRKKEKAPKSNNNQKGNPEVSKIKNGIAKPKIEEVLPKTQAKKNQSGDKKSETAPKKAPKQERVADQPKPKTPKSIESALNAIDAKEFAKLYDNSKAQFPDAPVVWLKEIAQFLNQRLNVDIQDPVFSTRPTSYPLSVVPSGIKSVIAKAAGDVSPSNLQLFFDISLTSLVTDMSKNLPGLGHKILLQYIVSSRPGFASANLQKQITLRNSYQNRPSIGLSILWVLGQAGYHDIHVGFKVFQELMLPLIELKNYSRFVITYLIGLFDNQNSAITPEQYLALLNITTSNYKHFPNELRKDWVGLTPRLKNALLLNGKADQTVDFLLKKLDSVNNSYHDHFCEVITECFIKDQTSLVQWSKIYKKNISSSAILLKYFDDHWSGLHGKINVTLFRKVIVDLLAANAELIGRKKKEAGLDECVELLGRLSRKMVNQGRSGPSFLFIALVLTFAVTAFVQLDLKFHGSYEESITRETLQQLEKATVKVRYGWNVTKDKIEETFPGTLDKVSEFSESYIELAKNLGILFYNILINIRDAIVEKYPVVIETIESQMPGLIEQSQKAAYNVWTTSVVYVNQSIDYLRKEVFVGQLSPENVQRVVLDALNTTQVKATEYYHWIYEKVQTSIK